MTIPLDKQDKLRLIFSALPKSSIDILCAAFTSGLESNDRSLPFETLLGLMPPSTDTSMPDLDELFFPLGQLVSEHATRPDQIPPQMLEDVWNFFATQINPELAKTWHVSDDAFRQNKKQLAIGFRSLLEEEGGKAHLATALGKENSARIPMIISVLSFAEEIGELVVSWPAQIKELDDQYLLPLRDLNDLLVETNPDITPYLLFFLKSRLRHPQHILRAIERLSRQNSDMVIVNTDMNIIVDVLLDEAEELLETSLLPVIDDAHVVEIAGILNRFADLITGSTDEFDISPTSSWGKRLYKISSLAGRLWTRRIEKAWDAIDQSTPRIKTKSFLGGSLTGPDLNGLLNHDVADAAARDAYLLAQIFPYCSKLGLSGCREKISKLIDDRMLQQETDLISLIADPGEVEQEILDNHFSTLVRISGKYYGEEIANILSRRGVAAAAAAA